MKQDEDDRSDFSRKMQPTPEESAVISTRNLQTMMEAVSKLRKIVRIGTGVPGLDRVLGGGLVQGSTLLIGGDSSSGKNVMAVQIAGAFLNWSKRVVYVSDKGAARTPISRARHPIGKLAARILGEASGKIEIVGLREMDRLYSSFDMDTLVVVDAIDTIERSDQQRGKLCRYFAKVSALTGATIVLLCGVTREGVLRGPMTIPHYVDVILRVQRQRAASANFKNVSCDGKNRFGPDGLDVNMYLTDKGFSDWP